MTDNPAARATESIAEPGGHTSIDSTPFSDQALYQPDHLLRTTKKMAAGFDVHDFHSNLPGIDFVIDRG